MSSRAVIHVTERELFSYYLYNSSALILNHWGAYKACEECQLCTERLNFETYSHCREQKCIEIIMLGLAFAHPKENIDAERVHCSN